MEFTHLSQADLAHLPDDIRADVERSGLAGNTEYRAPKPAAVKAPPRGQRDESLVEIFCLAKCSPWADVAEAEEVETEVPAGVEKIRHPDGYEDVQVEDGVDGKGKPKFKTEQRPKFRIEERPLFKTEFVTRYRMVNRPLRYQEKVKTPRWLADIMKANDHILIIPDLIGDKP